MKILQSILFTALHQIIALANIYLTYGICMKKGTLINYCKRPDC